MIQPQELRISNYIIREDLFDKNKRIEKITELYKEKALCSGPISVFVDYKDLQPIPLTEEWLLKFGFELKNWGIKVWYLKGFEIDQHFYLKGIDWGVRFKYVHQLQNLYFALTGKELTLKK